MKHVFLSFFIGGLVVAGLFGGTLVAHAISPTLSVSSAGNSDSVLITVNGDSYASVGLFYQKVNYGLQSQYLGVTNSNGYFSTIVSASAYGINPGSYVYAVINSQQSSNVAWPSYYASGMSGSGPSLNQNNLSLSVGQSVNIIINGGFAPYTMYPSAPNVFQSTIAGNTLTVWGLTNGSGSLNICSSGGSGSGCTILYVTVGGGTNYTNYNTQQLSLGQNSATLNVGGSITISIYGNGGYYISSNTNSNVATAYTSGSQLVVTGNNSGNNTITICQTGGQCASFYVTVGYGGYNGYGGVAQSAMTFSQNNPALSIGQSTNISIYGGTGNGYYIAYNSNSNSVQTNISGSTITVTGLTNSTTAVVVCSSSTNCGALTITVGSVAGASYYNYNNRTFCGNEGQYCSFSGTQTVQYGANGVYYYRTFTNGAMCSNAVFGDPIFGVAKQCSFGG